MDYATNKERLIMSGIYGIFSKVKTEVFNIYEYFYSASLDNVTNEEVAYGNYICGRSVISKFLNDRVLYEDSEIIICFEGVYFNKSHRNSSCTIKSLYESHGINFVAEIKGQFSGFIYDKKIDELFVFNDHLSTKPIYIYKNNDVFIFASELKVVTRLLTILGIQKELDYDAVYCFLIFGYLLNNITYEKNIKKLEYATILHLDSDLNVEHNQYYEYKKKQNFSLSKFDIIKSVDDLIIKSVECTWNKNVEYNYEQYAFLSGGLDSRANVLLAKNLGFNNINAMTFSQKGSSDHIIAQEIALKENLKYKFYPLDNGYYLEGDIEDYVYANDGLAVLHGAAAGFSILKNNKHKNLGGLHTGQIGDVLFGSFVQSNFSVQDGMFSDKKELMHKVSFMDSIQDKYNNNPEIFSFEQRQQNNTLNGDRTYAHFVDVFSPFYDRDLIDLCLTIPNKYKEHEAIYIDWFNKKHPYISNYIWESAGVKPKYIRFVRVAKIIKRYKNGLLRRVGLNVNDVNPFDVWLRNNPKILINLNLIYNKYIDDIKDLELKEMLVEMYEKDIKYSYYGRNNKFLVVTLLISLNLHFGEFK